MQHQTATRPIMKSPSPNLPTGCCAIPYRERDHIRDQRTVGADLCVRPPYPACNLKPRTRSVRQNKYPPHLSVTLTIQAATRDDGIHSSSKIEDFGGGWEGVVLSHQIKIIACHQFAPKTKHMPMHDNSVVPKHWLKQNYGLRFARTSWKTSIFAASIPLEITSLIFVPRGIN